MNTIAWDRLIDVLGSLEQDYWHEADKKVLFKYVNKAITGLQRGKELDAKADDSWVTDCTLDARYTADEETMGCIKYARCKHKNVHVLRIAAKASQKEVQRFDVLEHLRNGGEAITNDGAYIFKYDIDAQYMYCTRCADGEDVGGEHEMFVDYLFSGALVEYKEPDPTDFLENGKWYWTLHKHITIASHGGNEELPMRFMGDHWWHGGAQISLEAVTPKINPKTNRPIECVEGE